jgi:intein/homing endonuclease
VKKAKEIIPTLSEKSLPSLALEPKIKPKNHYFDNDLVQEILKRYVARGCVDIELRDEIMHHAEELIRQVIRAHNFEHIFPNRDSSSALELFQVAYCVSLDTMLFTDNGIMKINDIINNSFNRQILCNGLIGEIDIMVNGINGLSKANKYCLRNNIKTKKIKIKYDYELECTNDHPILVLKPDGHKWINAGDLKKNDYVGLQYNQNIWINNNKIDFKPLTKGGTTYMWNPPSEWTEELAYIVGLVVSEGSVEDYRIVIYNGEVNEILQNNNCGLIIKYDGNLTNAIGCIRFAEFIKWLGISNSALTKKIPEQILKCSKNIISSFLSGMFDGDGHSNKSNGRVGYTSSSKILIEQLRMLMLNYGIVTQKSADNRKFSLFRNKKCDKHTSWQVLFPTIDSMIFYNEIGFKIKRKQNNKVKLSDIPFRYLYGHYKQHTGNILKYIKKLDRKCLKPRDIITPKILSRLLLVKSAINTESYKYLSERLSECSGNNKIIWLPVKEINDSISDVIDITVPLENNFVANGIITHNCQIEKVLYKYDPQPGSPKLFNLWSQVSKTRILAYLKKEKRDKKNVVSYKDFLNRKQKIKLKNSTDIDLWLKEAREMLEYNEDFLKIVDAIEKIWYDDEKSHDGLISKIEKTSGKNRNIISHFFKTIRIRRDEFTVNLLEVKDPKDPDASDVEDFFYIDHDQ